MSDNKNYINFGDFARRELHMQSQYASHYADGIGGAPDFGKDLRIHRGRPGDYHTYKIHKDDAPIFKKRVTNYRKTR